jgi:hypothetical protein
MTDMSNLLSVAVLLPLLHEMQLVAKLMQSRDVYLPDLGRAILRTKERVHELYVGEAKFADKNFNLLARFRNVLKTKEGRSALSPLYKLLLF